MKKLRLKEQENIFKKILDNYFKLKGYKYFHEYQNINYRKFDNNSCVLQSTIYGKNSGAHIFVNEISVIEIEKIVMEIGVPNIDFSTYNKNSLLATLRDNQNNFFSDTKVTLIETEEDCILYCEKIIKYMETDGKIFIEKYSYLPNVLTEMDRLERDGKYWNGLRGKGGIINGMGEAFFKGLIISKLCGDPDFNRKSELVAKIFEEDIQWIPYYEKLKEKLKTIEPVYDL